MDVMGTFFKLSPWPSFWWNLNIQLTYMPIGPANRMEQGKNFQRLMDEVFPSLVRSIEPCKIGDYTWALQNYYMYLRYAGADWQDIKQQVVPKALDAFAVFDKILCYKENTWHRIGRPILLWIGRYIQKQKERCIRGFSQPNNNSIIGIFISLLISALF